MTDDVEALAKAILRDSDVAVAFEGRYHESLHRDVALPIARAALAYRRPVVTDEMVDRLAKPEAKASWDKLAQVADPGDGPNDLFPWKKYWEANKEAYRQSYRLMLEIALTPEDGP